MTKQIIKQLLIIYANTHQCHKLQIIIYTFSALSLSTSIFASSLATSSAFGFSSVFTFFVFFFFDLNIFAYKACCFFKCFLCLAFVTFNNLTTKVLLLSNECALFKSFFAKSKSPFSNPH